eukprot:5642666-Alexandrium_andersonii.AAC.1
MAGSKIAQFTPQGLCNLSWAFAVIGEYDEQVFRSIASYAAAKIEGFTPQDNSVLADSVLRT